MKSTCDSRWSANGRCTFGLIALVGMAGLVTAAFGAATLADGGSTAALQRAASANKHLLVFIYEGSGETTATQRKNFEVAIGKLGDQAQWTAVDRSQPGEKAFVDNYGLDRAPMPLVLAIAPNGAITGGFPASEGTEERLRGALASVGLQRCLKALQDRRFVMVCLQNARTEANEEAMKGVNEFRANSQFGTLTEVVKVDPSDAKEATLLRQLKADPQTKIAVTAFLAPPGVLVAKVDGPTTKDGLMASLQKAMASCAPGSSCCPAPKQ